MLCDMNGGAMGSSVSIQFLTQFDMALQRYVRFIKLEINFGVEVGQKIVVIYNFLLYKVRLLDPTRTEKNRNAPPAKK